MLFSSQQSGRKSVVVQGVVGTGPHRKIVVASPSHTARQRWLCFMFVFHVHPMFAVGLSVSRSVSQSVCLSVSLSVCLSLCLSVCLSLSVSLVVCLSLCLSVSQFVCLSVCLSSVCLSITICTCFCSATQLLCFVFLVCHVLMFCFLCSTHGQSAAMPTPSLEFANICLRNAWQLLPQLNSATESSPPPIHVEQSGVSGDPGELVTGDARRGKDSGQHTVVSATSMLPMRAQEINGLR